MGWAWVGRSRGTFARAGKRGIGGHDTHTHGFFSHSVSVPDLFDGILELNFELNSLIYFIKPYMITTDYSSITHTHGGAVTWEIIREKMKNFTEIQNKIP